MVSSPSPKAVRRHERSQSLLSPLPSTSELPYRQLSPQSSRGSTAWTERFNSAGSRAGGKRRAGAESAVVVGKKKSYFVDVVVDGLETDEDGGYLRPDGACSSRVVVCATADPSRRASCFQLLCMFGHQNRQSLRHDHDHARQTRSRRSQRCSHVYKGGLRNRGQLLSQNYCPPRRALFFPSRTLNLRTNADTRRYLLRRSAPKQLLTEDC